MIEYVSIFGVLLCASLGRVGYEVRRYYDPNDKFARVWPGVVWAFAVAAAFTGVAWVGCLLAQPTSPLRFVSGFAVCVALSGLVLAGSARCVDRLIRWNEKRLRAKVSS